MGTFSAKFVRTFAKRKNSMTQQEYDHLLYEMLRAIWYHSYNLKNAKNAHGGVLLLVLQAELAFLLKVTLPNDCFSRI